MKFKIIASVLFLLIIVAALALKGCSSQAVDENGQPVPTEQAPQ